QLRAVLLLARVSFFERQVLGFTQRLLADPQTERALCCDRRREGPDCIVQFAGFDQLVDESDSMGLSGIDRLTREEHPTQCALWNEPAQMSAAAAAADVDLRQCKRRCARGNSDVTYRRDDGAGA